MIDLKAKKEQAMNPEEEKSGLEEEEFEYASELQTLVEMGYEEAKAKKILIEVKGNVGMAVS